LDLHVSNSFFLNAWTFMCPYIFLIAHVSFVTIDGERDQHISFILWVVMDDTMLTFHRNIARGYMVCT
jgi:hypothetical protein